MRLSPDIFTECHSRANGKLDFLENFDPSIFYWPGGPAGEGPQVVPTIFYRPRASGPALVSNTVCPWCHSTHNTAKHLSVHMRHITVNCWLFEVVEVLRTAGFSKPYSFGFRTLALSKPQNRTHLFSLSKGFPLPFPCSCPPRNMCTYRLWPSVLRGSQEMLGGCLDWTDGAFHVASCHKADVLAALWSCGGSLQ